MMIMESYFLLVSTCTFNVIIFPLDKSENVGILGLSFGQGTIRS